MKYKVGDKVRVRSDLVAIKRYGGHTFISEMEKFKSKIVTIEQVISNGYRIKEDNDMWLWTDEMFVPVTFAKSDLKTGHVVEYRNGKRRLVVGNALIDDGGHEANDLTNSRYENDLIDISGDKHLDICKVYEIKPSFIGDLYELLSDTNNLILIWERMEEDPPKKMTVAEIEAVLGHKVEIVAEEAKQ